MGVQVPARHAPRVGRGGASRTDQINAISRMPRRARSIHRRVIRTFGELLERHEREILGYALRLVGDRDEADDIYQETFLAAFRGWPPPRRGQERAWLYRIATNK